MWNPVLLFDAAGLAFFAVSGAQKALNHGLEPVMATSLGMLTGIGGGMMRDVLLTEIPTVLRSELYAVAALLGAAVVVGGHLLRLPIVPVAIAGLSLCFGLRVLAIRYGWQLPVAKAPDQQVSRPDDVDVARRPAAPAGRPPARGAGASSRRPVRPSTGSRAGGRWSRTRRRPLRTG